MNLKDINDDDEILCNFDNLDFYKKTNSIVHFLTNNKLNYIITLLNNGSLIKYEMECIHSGREQDSLHYRTMWNGNEIVTRLILQTELFDLLEHYKEKGDVLMKRIKSYIGEACYASNRARIFLKLVEEEKCRRENLFKEEMKTEMKEGLLLVSRGDIYIPIDIINLTIDYAV